MLDQENHEGFDNVSIDQAAYCGCCEGYKGALGSKTMITVR